MIKTCTTVMLALCKSVKPQCWKEVLATSDLQDKAGHHLRIPCQSAKFPYGTTRYCCAIAKATVFCKQERVYSDRLSWKAASETASDFRNIPVRQPLVPVCKVSRHSFAQLSEKPNNILDAAHLAVYNLSLRCSSTQLRRVCQCFVV